MEPQIRFCTSADGTRIAYATFGDRNLPPLVAFNGWGHMIEGFNTLSWGRRFVEVPLKHRYIVEFDRRGTGGSQREAADLSLGAQVADLVAVVDAVGLEQFELIGWFDGCAVALSFAADYPDRVSRLVLASPFAASSDTWMGTGADQTAQLI